MATFRLKINPKVDEEKLLEHCLNLKCSGYDPTILIGLFAFGKRWDVNKFIYYWNLIAEAK